MSCNIVYLETYIHSDMLFLIVAPIVLFMSSQTRYHKMYCNYPYHLFRPNEAAMKYLFLSELGYEQAQTNFAYILDKG